MKIVAIIGSPRGRGSGYMIVKMIEERMMAIGLVEFEYLFLNEANLELCRGCYTCMARGEEHCPLKDDRAVIEQKLLEADGIILSSPVHVSNVSWIMKNFIDRFAYTNHRPRFHRQKVMTLVNMAGTDKKEALSALKHSMGGAQFVCELAVATPPWRQTVQSVAAKEGAIDAAAEKFYRTCLDMLLPVPTFRSRMSFFLYQQLVAECRESLPADYLFYHGRSYYYDTTGSRLPLFAARAVSTFMMFVYFRTQGMGPGRVAWPTAMMDR